MEVFVPVSPTELVREWYSHAICAWKFCFDFVYDHKRRPFPTHHACINHETHLQSQLILSFFSILSPDYLPFRAFFIPVLLDVSPSCHISFTRSLLHIRPLSTHKINCMGISVWEYHSRANTVSETGTKNSHIWTRALFWSLFGSAPSSAKTQFS